jgi:hypothetical protein
MDSPASGWRPVVGSCEYVDEPLGSGTTELVSPKEYFSVNNCIMKHMLCEPHNMVLTIKYVPKYNNVATN